MLIRSGLEYEFESMIFCLFIYLFILHKDCGYVFNGQRYTIIFSESRGTAILGFLCANVCITKFAKGLLPALPDILASWRFSSSLPDAGGSIRPHLHYGL